MDGQLHRLLGKYVPDAIAVAKRHALTVDALMVATVSDGALTSEMAVAVTELRLLAPGIERVAWPATPRASGRSEQAAVAAEAEAHRVAEKLSKREAARERARVARELEKATKVAAVASDAVPRATRTA